MANYIGLIHKDADSDYGVSFPDFPGCVSAGVTLDEARAGAEEALALHIEGMMEDGLPIPEPASLEDVMSDPANRDGVAILVRTPDSDQRSIRVNVTFPEDVLREIDLFAQDTGYTRSGFLARAAKHEIERETQRKTRA
jgi:predicted RNase H-like HicB family nuclease